jgi:hypothetical protein
MPDPTLVSQKTKYSDKGVETEYTYESFDGYLTEFPEGVALNNVSFEEGDGVFRTTYTVGGDDGGGGGGAGSQPQFSITANTGQTPLQQHPIWAASGQYPIEDSEWEKFRLWQSDPANPTLNGWPSSSVSAQYQASENMQRFLDKWNKGIESFLQAGVTIQVMSEGESEPDCSGVGYIAKPDLSPVIHPNANWLLTGINATKAFGESWKVTREYRMSDQLGWDEDLYSKPD